jgi:hypothetical protein
MPLPPIEPIEAKLSPQQTDPDLADHIVALRGLLHPLREWDGDCGGGWGCMRFTMRAGRSCILRQISGTGGLRQ